MVNFSFSFSFSVHSSLHFKNSFSFSFSVIFNFSFSVYSTLPSKCLSGSLMFSGSRFNDLEVNRDYSRDTLHFKNIARGSVVSRSIGIAVETLNISKS